MRFCLLAKGRRAVCVLSALALTAGCTWRSDGKRPFWKFWAPRQVRAVEVKPFSLEIPPPEATISPAALQALEPPTTGALQKSDEGAYKRAPATVIHSELKIAYFDYDSAALTEETKEILRENALWLQQHKDIEVQLQGHCDERGTVEYNFNLGQRRANAVKAFLVELAISPSRIHTISYGEERPAVRGSDEEAWRLNRRVEFHAFQ